MLLIDLPSFLILDVLCDLDDILVANLIGDSSELALGLLHFELLNVFFLFGVHGAAAVGTVRKNDEDDEEDQGQHGFPDVNLLVDKHDVKPDVGKKG